VPDAAGDFSRQENCSHPSLGAAARAGMGLSRRSQVSNVHGLV